MQLHNEYENDISKIITCTYANGHEYKYVLSYQEWLENCLLTEREKNRQFSDLLKQGNTKTEV